MFTYTFILSTWKASLCVRLVWSMQQVPGQPGLSQPNKQCWKRRKSIEPRVDGRMAAGVSHRNYSTLQSHCGVSTSVFWHNQKWIHGNLMLQEKVAEAGGYHLSRIWPTSTNKLKSSHLNEQKITVQRLYTIKQHFSLSAVGPEVLKHLSNFCW